MTITHKLQLALAIMLVLLSPGSLRAQNELPSTFDAYDAVHSRVAEMQAAGQTRDATQGVVEEWLQARDISQMRIEQARWCLEQCLPQKADRKEFAVVWTGEITPPMTGEFVFSVSPINVNKIVEGEEVRHTITVAVDGKPVVNATAEQWNWKGTPIQFQAGQSVPIRVELTYRASVPTYSDSPHALLYWEAPGLSRQIVPSSVLSPPGGEGNGLAAEYRWTEIGQPQQANLLDRNIEFAWASCRDIAPRNPELVAALTQRLWEACTDAAYIAEQTSDPPPPHVHVYFRNYTSAEFLTCAQRREFLQLLLQNPELLGIADQTQILRLYATLRFGDADAVLDMLGTWMQQRPDVETAISDEFFEANRHFYRHVALYIVWRMPDQYLLLQDHYLEMPDGRCCLPVAYTLAYSYLMKGEIRSWIELLEAKLEDEDLPGDKRVNWLIARAHAEEIRELPSGRNYARHEPLLAGSGWLDEASLIAESDEVKLRVTNERLTRFIGLDEWTAVDRELEHIGNSPQAQQRAAAWKSKVDSMKAQITEQVEDHRRKAKQAYVDELIRRRASAASLGELNDIAAYDKILTELGASENSSSQ